MPTATPLFDGHRRQGETVCWVKQHRTSKCSSSCGKEMLQAALHKQQPPTEVELKARARSKLDRQIKRKAHLLVKLASKHIQQDNQQAVPLSILPRPLPITQDEADMAIKFARSEATSKVAARLEAALTAALQAAAQDAASAPAPMDGNGSSGSGANAARQQTNRKRQPPRPGDRKLSRPPPVSVMPQLKGADRMVAKNYDAKNLLMPWGVRKCGHCDTIWFPDKNACINMLLRAIFYLRQPLKDPDAPEDIPSEDESDGVAQGEAPARKPSGKKGKKFADQAQMLSLIDALGSKEEATIERKLVKRAAFHKKEKEREKQMQKRKAEKKRELNNVKKELLEKEKNKRKERKSDAAAIAEAAAAQALAGPKKTVKFA
ncbi:hypothetical protein HK105_208274 [Polyrhizophydium stewartii]|uniref:Uncharacterized protein n=1 Tax=Polyrhizophydium stewartii TaxID=2732419 RepID=A0ABR4MY66_9FUNG